MKEIKGFPGFTFEYDNKGNRIVKYKGEVCPMIGREETLCEENTSYYGCVMDSRETYKTPFGVLVRDFSARGPGLDRVNVNWFLLRSAKEEIARAQEEYCKAASALEAAEAKLKMYAPEALSAK